MAEYRVEVDPILDICDAAGVQVIGLHASVAPRRQIYDAQLLLEKY